jgi:hypothetical protein
LERPIFENILIFKKSYENLKRAQYFAWEKSLTIGSIRLLFVENIIKLCFTWKDFSKIYQFLRLSCNFLIEKWVQKIPTKINVHFPLKIKSQCLGAHHPQRHAKTSHANLGQLGGHYQNSQVDPLRQMRMAEQYRLHEENHQTFMDSALRNSRTPIIQHGQNAHLGNSHR